MEEYTVGSLGDLISGQKTDGKVKVVQKEFHMIQKNSEPTGKLKGENSSEGKLKGKKKKKQKFQDDVEEENLNGNVKDIKKNLKRKKKERLQMNGDDTISTKKQKAKSKNIEKAAEDQIVAEDVEEHKPNNKKRNKGNVKTKLKKSDIETKIEDETLKDSSDDDDNEEPPKKQKLDEINDTDDIDIEDLELPEPNDDSSDEETEATKKKKVLHNAEKRIKSKEHKVQAKEKEEVIQDIPQHHDRTVFVGNVDIKCSKKTILTRFSKYGPIETIRFRNAPIADIRTPKKVAIIKKEFHKDGDTLNAFIRFEKREDALKSLVQNGNLLHGKHIRVDMCDSDKKHNNKKAIFLGNLCFRAKDEDLWKLFEPCGAIESIRIIKDNRTNIGKGFGYINFVSADSVQLALDMGEVELNNRVIRISNCSNNKPKNKNKVEKPKKPRYKKVSKDDDDEKINGDFQGSKFSEKKKKKKVDKGALQKKKMIKMIAPKV